MRDTRNTYWDFDAMLAERGLDYLEDVRHIRVAAMEDAYELLGDDDGYNVRLIAQKIYYGGKFVSMYNDHFQDGFEYWADYVIDDRSGWYSLHKEDMQDFLKHTVNEDDFYDWCVDWGYIDNGEE